MATTMINGVIHHDGVALGIDVLAAALRPGPASLAFPHDEFNADTALGLYPHQITAMLDIDSGPNLQLEFYNWLMEPYQKQLALIGQLENMRPSNVGKSEQALSTYAARMMRRGTYGKLAPTPEQMQHQDEASAMMARMFKAMFAEPEEVRVNRTMHRIVRHICANWSAYK